MSYLSAEEIDRELLNAIRSFDYRRVQEALDNQADWLAGVKEAVIDDNYLDSLRILLAHSPTLSSNARTIEFLYSLAAKCPNQTLATRRYLLGILDGIKVAERRERTALGIQQPRMLPSARRSSRSIPKFY